MGSLCTTTNHIYFWLRFQDRYEHSLISLFDESLFIVAHSTEACIDHKTVETESA